MAKNFLRIDRQKFTGILSILILLAAGILLLMRPQLMTDLAVWVLACVLLVLGVCWLVRYLRATPEEGAKGYDLAEALIAFSAGGVLLLRRELFDALLPLLWGALLVLGGFMILQTAVDFLRMKYVRWWILLIGAVIALALGTIALVSPSFLEGRLPVYIGASLIAEAVINLVCLILMALHSRGKLPLSTDRPKIKKAAPAPAAASAQAKPAEQKPAPAQAEKPEASAKPEATAKPAAPSPEPAPRPAAAEAPAAPAPAPEPEPPREAPATIFEELARYAEEDQKNAK